MKKSTHIPYSHTGFRLIYVCLLWKTCQQEITRADVTINNRKRCFETNGSEEKIRALLNHFKQEQSDAFRLQPYVTHFLPSYKSKVNVKLLLMSYEKINYYRLQTKLFASEQKRFSVQK